MRRYLGRQFVDKTQAMGVYPGDEGFQEIIDMFNRERDELVAEASGTAADSVTVEPPQSAAP